LIFKFLNTTPDPFREIAVFITVHSLAYRHSIVFHTLCLPQRYLAVHIHSKTDQASSVHASLKSLLKVKVCQHISV